MSGAGASGQVTSMDSSNIGQAQDTPWLPTEHYCPKCNNNNETSGFTKFCPHCGTKLESRVADLYIELKHLRYAPLKDKDPTLKTTEPESINKHPVDPFLTQEKRDNYGRISIRDFIKMLKKYEKELFIEEI